MQRKRTGLNILLILLLLTFSATLAAQQSSKKPGNANSAKLPAVIWRNADSVGSLNLFYGAGGQEHAPDVSGKYTFVKENLEGSNPKLEVRDAQGVVWKVKLGKEAQSEVAATRLLWATGYFVDEDYYLSKLKVSRLPKLHRGNEFVSAGGTVHGVRLERRRKDVKNIRSWSWFSNPFLGRREFNGLRVMMALLNNWDLKEANNSIQQTSGERRYVVTDLGATFGKTGNSFTRSRNDLKDYANSKFVDKVTAGFVDFEMESRPFAAAAIDVSYYKKRAKMEHITEHIPRADAQWLGQILAQLSAEQIRDCFRAAGYTSAEVEGFTKAVQRRIAQLNAL